MTSTSDPLLSVRGATFGYGGHAVISGVNVDVHAGDLLGIVGPNGSGKTTLFRGLLGLIPPMAGEVKLGRAPVGYVPQREELDAVYPLSVDEIVQMGSYGRITGPRKFWRSPPRAERLLVAECLEFVGLAGTERAEFASLSGGQRQRVLLARALMTKPQLLMLDEPTAGVDRGASREILARISDLHRERNLAVLLVAHQLDQVRDLTDEVLLVRDGAVVRGPSQELLSPESIETLFGGGAGS